MSDEPQTGAPEPAPEPAPDPAPDAAPEPDETDDESGPLLDFDEGEALETHDRRHAGPGGEPECPRCGTAMVRSVEKHRGPRSDDSPFRVRLVCGSTACRAWTLYNW